MLRRTDADLTGPIAAQVVSGGVFGLQELASATKITMGRRYATTVDLEATSPTGLTGVVNVATRVEAPNQVVVDERDRQRLLQNWRPGHLVTVSTSGAKTICLSTPQCHRPDLALGLQVTLKAASRSWFATAEGQQFGVPAIRRALADDLADGLVGLCGLGPGLTPSGDDALIALIAWRNATGEPMSVFDQLVDQLPHRTTPASSTLIRCAIAGQTSWALNQLLVSLEAGSVMAAQEAVALVAAQGHTSGADALYLLREVWSKTLTWKEGESSEDSGSAGR